VWADNADAMSEQYTGTGALKNDFTRTGKRSVKGMATDGINSMKRYINKTFQFDDMRQASCDIFLGKFEIGKINFVSLILENYLQDHSWMLMKCIASMFYKLQLAQQPTLLL
jgi:hypothetical protein